MKRSPPICWPGAWRALLVAGMALLAGCTSLSSHRIAYLGAPRPGPSNPAKVEILQGEPARAYDRLGEVVVNASIEPAPPIDKIEGRLRRDAAELGADAIFLVQDRAEHVGAVATGPWWSQSITPITGRVIVGIAIKYK